MPHYYEVKFPYISPGMLHHIAKRPQSRDKALAESIYRQPLPTAAHCRVKKVTKGVAIARSNRQRHTESIDVREKRQSIDGESLP
jgi:hypothetical protein